MLYLGLFAKVALEFLVLCCDHYKIELHNANGTWTYNNIITLSEYKFKKFSWHVAILSPILFVLYG